MLLGLDFNLWTQPLLEKAVFSFGQLLIWEEDHFYMSRAIIKVRVSDLDEIPWFFVFSEGTDFESDSWTVQCEVLHIRMLGSAAQDEDLPPGDDDFDPNNFFYYGFGQFGQGPPHHQMTHLHLSSWSIYRPWAGVRGPIKQWRILVATFISSQMLLAISNPMWMVHQC